MKTNVTTDGKTSQICLVAETRLEEKIIDAWDLYHAKVEIFKKILPTTPKEEAPINCLIINLEHR